MHVQNLMAGEWPHFLLHNQVSNLYFSHHRGPAGRMEMDVCVAYGHVHNTNATNIRESTFK